MMRGRIADTYVLVYHVKYTIFIVYIYASFYFLSATNLNLGNVHLIALSITNGQKYGKRSFIIIEVVLCAMLLVLKN